MEKPNRTYRCECGSELLLLDAWSDSKHVDLAIFNLGYDSGKMSVWRRIKYAFKVLTKGALFHDQICLSLPSITLLRIHLQEIEKDFENEDTN